MFPIVFTLDRKIFDQKFFQNFLVIYMIDRFSPKNRQIFCRCTEEFGPPGSPLRRRLEGEEHREVRRCRRVTKFGNTRDRGTRGGLQNLGTFGAAGEWPGGGGARRRLYGPWRFSPVKVYLPAGALCYMETHPVK